MEQEYVTRYGDVDAKELETWKVDQMIEDIKSNNDDLKRYKEILDNRIEELKQQYEQKKQSIEKKNSFMLTTLREYAMLQDSLKQTKTQFKYSSLNGDIIIKKPKQNFVKPSDDLVEGIEKLYPELVETETSKKLNWKDLKSKLVMQNDRIFDKETGEDLTDYIQVELKEESVEVK